MRRGEEKQRDGIGWGGGVVRGMVAAFYIYPSKNCLKWMGSHGSLVSIEIPLVLPGMELGCPNYTRWD